MSTPESFEALRRANPRRETGFEESVATAVDAARARIAAAPDPEPARGRLRARRRLVPMAAAGATLAAAVAVAVTLGSSGGGTGVENAAAAVRKAASVSAASAEQSGAAVVRITHDGRLWAGSTIRWNGADLAVSSDAPRRQGEPGSEMRVVGGTLYGIDQGAWVVLGSPKSIDPDSGTTPDEYLAAVREDVGGATLRRITDGMRGLTTTTLEDGSTVYRGTVPARLIASETGFKEGRSIRVLPFGYVAHGEAANPVSPLDVAVTVGGDGIVRAIAVRWGTSASGWTFTVTYSDLGATAAPVAPANAQPLRERLRSGN
jgi:hypothetical protein